MPARTSNHILLALSAADRALLEPDLEAVELPVRRQLAKANKPIEHIYFIDSGIASVVRNGSTRPVEVGIIGREGLSSIGALMGRHQSDFDIFIQIAGTGRRIRPELLCIASERSPTLHRDLMRYAYSYLLQVAMTATSNGRNRLEERLARWLLLAQDRAGDELSFTHEFLGLMLCTTRPGVTVAIKNLEAQNLIQPGRGRIKILDRDGLMQRTNDTYSPQA
jgi:CRP-like cAMP-binding protein